MHLTEANMISCRSEYFLYSATPKMRNCMYYPHRVGLGDFMPGYRLSRTPMNNFLIAYISEGSFRIRFADVDAIAHEGQFLIVDCYEPHRFSTDESCRDIWLHYDGPAARNMYEYIVGRSGNVIDAGRSGHGLHEMHAIFDMLKAGRGGKGGRTIASHRWRVGFACVRRQVERPAQRRPERHRPVAAVYHGTPE